LIEDLKSELGGNFETVAVDLFKTAIDYDCDQLYHAMKGMGTDEDTLIEIIGTRDNKRLTDIKQRYKVLYKSQLEDDVKSETSGNLQKMLVALLQCKRSEEHHVDHDLVKQDSQALFDAGEGSWGTDESEFNRILVLRSRDHIKSIIKH